MKRMRKCLIFLAVLFLLAGCQKKMGVQDYLDLGDKYLAEANYEEAIVAFTKAIELEPKAVTAYEGLANAYIKTENYPKAQETIISGIAVYEGLAEEERTDEYTQSYEALLKLQEEVAAYLNRENDAEKESETAETVPEETVSEKDFSEYQELIDDVQEKIASGDRDSIWQRQSEDDYQLFITELDRVLAKDCGDGNWLLIYPCGHCYYGGMENGKRSGHGIWCDYDYGSEFMGYVSCTWKDDYPNGEGEEWGVCMNAPEDLTYYQVNLKDGMYDGTVRETYLSNVEGNNFSDMISYECSDGIAAEVQDLHPEERHDYDDGKEWYCYYSDENGSSYTVRGRKKGITHARKGWDDEKSMNKEGM